MARYDKNRLLLFKLEANPGTDANPAAASDCILFVDNFDPTPIDPTYAQRNIQFPYFGASQDLLAASCSRVKFSVELSASGVAGVTALWGPLLQCAGFSLSTGLLLPTRVESWPLSRYLKTGTFYFYDDGVLTKLVGAMGSVKLTAKHKETPKLEFDFVGAYSNPTAAANPTAALSLWKPPAAVAKANVSQDITLGCSYAAGALTGGTTFGSFGIEVDLGNALKYFTSNSSERAEITDRDAKCSFELELSEAQEVQGAADIFANTTTSLGFTLGSAAGSKLMLYMPMIHRRGYKKTNRDGIRTHTFDGCTVLPKSGNDEVVLIQL